MWSPHFTEVQRIDSDLRRIHREVRQNVELLRSKEAQATQADPEIPFLESQITSLQTELSAIQSQNQELHILITEKRADRTQNDARAAQFVELAELFEYHNQPFTGPDPPLSLADRSSVLSQFDSVVSNLTDEFTTPDLSELQNSLQEIHTLEEAVDRELSVLRQFDVADWTPSDPLGPVLDEFCIRFPRRETDPNFTLSRLKIPRLKTRPVPTETVLQIPLPNPPQLSRQSFGSLIGAHDTFLDKVYKDQCQFFELLKTRLVRQSRIDRSNLEKRLIDRLQSMRTPDSLKSLSLPSNSGQNATEIIGSRFAHFTAELAAIRPQSMVADFEHAAARLLNFPILTMPTSPKHIKIPVASPSLTRLVDELKAISESAKQLVPISAIQSLTASHRAALSAFPGVPSSPSPTADFVHNSEEEDRSALDDFRRVAASKLPPMLSARLFRVSDEFVVPDVDFPESAMVDQGAAVERSASINGMLRTMAAMELPAVPSAALPQTANLVVPELEVGVLREAVSRVLSPEELEAGFLRGEIEVLNERLQFLSENYDAVEPASDDEDVGHLRRERDRAKWELEKGQAEDLVAYAELTRLSEEKGEVARQNRALEEALADEEAVKAQIEEVEGQYVAMREMVKRKKAAIREAKETRAELLASRVAETLKTESG
jgi:hypothetical protein